jgi:uncharacterized membrane protein YgcG
MFLLLISLFIFICILLAGQIFRATNSRVRSNRRIWNNVITAWAEQSSNGPAAPAHMQWPPHVSHPLINHTDNVLFNDNLSGNHAADPTVVSVDSCVNYGSVDSGSGCDVSSFGGGGDFGGGGAGGDWSSN